jgi:phosphohistidine phosphatase SixA
MAQTTGGDPRARERAQHKFPTSGIAVLHVPDIWADTAASGLVAFAVPRG